MDRWMTRLQGVAILTAFAVALWLYLSPGARDCSERGGQYYLNGECGTFVWTPK